MSGGSFDYLCFAEPYDIFNKRDALKRMAEDLASDGHIDAAKETETVGLILNQFEALMRARLDRLHDLWRAVEWTRSGDTGPNAITEAIAEYRKAAGF